MPDYEIIAVRPEEIVGDEGMGSKTKFWFRRDGRRWLFKEAREGTGEDWAEKVVAEVARTAGVPAATVELAEFGGRRGCACLSFADPDNAETLIHGNEILAGFVLGYDPRKKFHQSDHTLENVFAAVRKMFPDKVHQDSRLTELARYLVLDALVGNTDRHHENWGVVLRAESDGEATRQSMLLAPSFDHASSLGRELLDDARAGMLAEGRVRQYVRRGHGAIFQNTTDRRGVNPLGMVESAIAGPLRGYFIPALQKLASVPLQSLQDTLAQVPVVRMSEVSKAFVTTFLAYTYETLTKLDA
ncbi:MAG: HipA domain-containing protein [Burkholderiales bacterium]